MAMPRETIMEPPVSVLDRNGSDRLLVALIEKHGEARPDIEPALGARANYEKNPWFREATKGGQTILIVARS
jgi:hypothetical protein